MSSTLVRPDEASVVDATAWRSVFASPEDTLVLAIVDPSQEQELGRIADHILELRKSGSRLRLVVCGDSSAILQAAGEEQVRQIGFLESWALPLFRAALALADVVVVLGERGETLLRECGEIKGGRPIIIRGDAKGDGLRATLSKLRSQGSTDSNSRKSSGTDVSPESAVRIVLKNDWGIGDELLLSAVAREIILAHPRVEIWIRSRFGFRFPNFVQGGPPPTEARSVETIYQNPALYGPQSHSPFPGHLVQQMLDKFALDTGLKVKARDIRPELDLGSPEGSRDGAVILHSGTNPRLPSKDWGVERWEQLARFLSNSGVRLKQVGGPEEPLLPNVEDLRGHAPKDLQEVFVRSSAVVCVVGFLMHLAEATRTPAVVIYGGREHPAIDGYPDQVHLSCEPLLCRGRWGCHLAADHQCPHGMKCMERITPELVSREVLTLLSSGGLR